MSSAADTPSVSGELNQSHVKSVTVATPPEEGCSDPWSFAPLTDELSASIDPVRARTAVVELQTEPIDITAVTQSALHPACGAVSTFLGTTRDHHGGRDVIRLEYEAYVPMAEREMRKIAHLIFERFDQVHRVAIVHRLGVVPVTESSVVIVVSTEHRASGLAAVAWAIDELKTTVPIWKLEVYKTDDGTEVKKEAPECSGCHGHGHGSHGKGHATTKPAAKWKSNPEFLARFKEMTVGTAVAKEAAPVPSTNASSTA